MASLIDRPERLFCVSCEGVFIPGRAPAPVGRNGTECPLCGSSNLRVWKYGHPIPDYQGREPDADVRYVMLKDGRSKTG